MMDVMLLFHLICWKPHFHDFKFSGTHVSHMSQKVTCVMTCLLTMLIVFTKQKAFQLVFRGN